MSETTIRPGQFAQADTQALAALSGAGTSVAKADFNSAGGYVPPEAKIYYETMDIAYGVGFGGTEGIAPGSFCFNKKDVVCGPKKVLTCVILDSSPYWREWKKYDPGVRARIWPTKEAAIRDGMDPVGSPYGSGGPLPNVGPAVQLALLVQEPAGGTGSMAFTLLLGGKRYAPARFRIAGTAFKNVEQTLATLAKRDASLRLVPQTEGKLSRYMTQFTVSVTAGADGKTKTRLNLNAAVDAEGKALEVPEAFWKDFAEYNRQLQACASACASSGDDEVPADPASGEPPVAVEL